MALKNKEINPLSVLNARRLGFIPFHFEKISLSKKLDIKLLEDWIEFNLNSRYAIKNIYMLDKDRKIVNGVLIGFENPKETTIFSLTCPYL
jgi:hypothetical protein